MALIRVQPTAADIVIANAITAHTDQLAASELPGRQRNAVWLIGAGLVATRVILLAHWTSDVLAGLAIGALVERWLRRFTGFGARGRETPAACRVES